jgi:hypothetical protein
MRLEDDRKNMPDRCGLNVCDYLTIGYRKTALEFQRSMKTLMPAVLAATVVLLMSVARGNTQVAKDSAESVRRLLTPRMTSASGCFARCAVAVQWRVRSENWAHPTMRRLLLVTAGILRHVRGVLVIARPSPLPHDGRGLIETAQQGVGEKAHARFFRRVDGSWRPPTSFHPRCSIRE